MTTMTAGSSTSSAEDLRESVHYSASSMRAQVLGDLRIDGESIGSGRVRALLARLAVVPGEIVSEDALMDAMWPDGPPKSARTALQTHVGALRDALESNRARRSDGSYLFRRHGGYMLDLGDELDASALRHAVERAETVRLTKPTVAASLLDRALELWKRPALAEFADAGWAIGHVVTLEEYATRALVLRMELALEDGGHADAVPRLEAAVGAHPYNERIVALLMRALHRSGRQADALKTYQVARSRLVDELGVEPGPELREAEREVLSSSPEAPAVARPARTIVDEQTHFVGRLRLQSELRRHLSERPLVTLVGPGGVGKTRLARRVVSALAKEWAVDVVFIDLADVAPGGAGSAIAERLGAVPHPRLDISDAIAASIEQNDTLLVLDTCEHLIDSLRALVDGLLHNPGIRILATSRSPLHHRGELTIELEPLTTDDAITLLLDRAGLDDVDQDRQALGEICRRLDGLPLAIELAAGRLRTLTPAQLAELLRRGRAALQGGDDRPLRHRNLAETIAWSYELLDEHAQRALRDIAVLRGAFTQEIAASFWGADDPDAATILFDLVDRSLISRHNSQSLHFRVLDTVREFALDRAEELGEREELEQRHASWVVSCIVNQAANKEGLSARDLASELRPALDRLAHTGRIDELVVTTMLGIWWVESSRISEGRRRLHDALGRHRQSPQLLVAPAEALAGLLAWYQGDGHAARELCEKMMPELDNIGLPALSTLVRAAFAFMEERFDDAETAAVKMLEVMAEPDWLRLFGLFTAGNISWYGGDDKLALERYTELRGLAQALDDSFQSAMAVRFQALATYTSGDSDRAWALAERGLSLAAAEGDLVSRAQARAILALISFGADDPDSAAAHALEAVRLSRANFDAFSLRVALPVVAATAAHQGATKNAATALGWLAHMLDDSGLFLAPASRRLVADTNALLSERLGDAAQRRLTACAAGMNLRDLARELDPTP